MIDTLAIDFVFGFIVLALFGALMLAVIFASLAIRSAVRKIRERGHTWPLKTL